jgi:prevent-host-death family protein
MRIPTIVPVSDFRRDAAAVLKMLQEDDAPVVLTQRGRGVAVVQSLDSYERNQRELALARALLAGETEAAAGQTHPAEDVLDRARALLNGAGD